MLVAFSANNLPAVAEMVRRRYPHREIILCADNDTETAAKIGKNPGIENARAAALKVGGLLAVPPEGGDFNDLMTNKGIGEVKAVIKVAKAVDPE